MVYQPFPSFADWAVEFDSSPVDRYAEQLRTIKASASPEQVDKVMTQALRTAAVDTGALEGLYATDRGFTRTVATATQAVNWKFEAAKRGDHVAALIEDAIAAYEMVLDAVTTQKLPFITEAWIRQLHETVCATQQTHRVFVSSLNACQEQVLPRGEYKRMPNSPTLPSGEVHDYASPLETPTEMARLIEELKTSEFIGAHFVMQAAYAHYAFVCVHPFADGNGRVARALASVFLYRRPGVPLVILADQRTEYLDALAAADAGEPSVFIRFIAERVIDTVNLLSQEFSAAAAGEEQAILDEIRSELAGRIDERILLAAKRLYDSAQARLKAAVRNIELPHGVSIRIGGPHQHRDSVLVPESYTLMNKSGIWITSDWVEAPEWFHIEVCTSSSSKDTAELLIVSDDGSEPFEVWLREIHPIESKTLALRLDAWAKEVILRFLPSILEGIRKKQTS